MSAISGLSRQVLIEARRGGLAWLACAVLAIALLLGWFLAQVALTESRQLQAAVTAALLRVCSVFLIAGHVVVSSAREYQDKSLELHLAQPISRSTHYLGRLSGHAGAGILLALLFSAPLLLWSDAARVAFWGSSLAIENILAACVALFFATAFGQALPAIAATFGVYLLGRSIATLQAIASGPLVEESTGQRLAGALTEGLSYLLPRLDLATRTDWLLYGSPEVTPYLAALGGMTCYILLLGAAGLFDFHRRDL